MLFISHSSKDNAQALRLKAWLDDEGWAGKVFLDLEEFRTGDRWRQRLDKAGGECEGVVVCLSNHWISSPECVREFTHAESRGKPIFPVIVGDVTLPIPTFVSALQFSDLSGPDPSAGFAKLKAGLVAARVAPGMFPWPPKDQPERPVYRGLQALDVQDAAIFFGRDAQIVNALDILRGMRDTGAKQILVIQGASGAGKSSFLRAGLIARLQRDSTRFLVLPVVRPERAALHGPRGLHHSIVAALGRQVALASATDIAEALAEIRLHAVARLLDSDNAGSEKPPTIILPIDQCEELFDAANKERSTFLTLVDEVMALDGNLLAVVTIRTDSFEPLQNGWRPDRQVVFSLPAVTTGAFKEIIDGPAALAKPPIQIEPALTQALLSDLNADDALPLLAFTLERLLKAHAGDGKLTLEDYRDGLRGLSGAIQAAVASTLGDNPSKETLAEVRSLFIPALVKIAPDGIKRQIAPRSEIPVRLQRLADQFIEQRILVSDNQTVEVAHEAILRQWPALVNWIRESENGLRILDGIRSAAMDSRWETQAGSPEEPAISHQPKKRARLAEDDAGDAWLLHRGQRLKEAVAMAASSEYAAAINPRMRAYLNACQSADEAQRGKRIAIFFDATWQRIHGQRLSNVQSLLRSVIQRVGRVEQVSIYIPGSGSQFDAFMGRNSSVGALLGLSMALSNDAIEQQILNAYLDLALRYEPGDKIYIFGYSRGAFSARSLASLINKCGILSRAHLEKTLDAFRLFRDPRSEPDGPEATEFRLRFCAHDQEGESRDYRPSIAYLGIFDTVGVRGVPRLGLLSRVQSRRYEFYDLNLPKQVRAARHALSIDERRAPFPPCPFENFMELNADASRSGRGVPYKQMWFAGTHTDMGGGNSSRLSEFPLEWIAEGAEEAGLRLDWSAKSPLGRLEHLSGDATLEPITRPPLGGLLNPINWNGRWRRISNQEHASLDSTEHTLHPSVVQRILSSAQTRRPYRPPPVRPFEKSILGTQ